MLMVLIFVISFIDGERPSRVDDGGVNIYYHKKKGSSTSIHFPIELIIVV